MSKIMAVLNHKIETKIAPVHHACAAAQHGAPHNMGHCIFKFVHELPRQIMIIK